MDTQTIVTLAVAINVAVALAAIVLPRIAHRRARTATRRFAASLPPLSTAGSGDSGGPASAWFPGRAGRAAGEGPAAPGPGVLAGGRGRRPAPGDRLGGDRRRPIRGRRRP